MCRSGASRYLEARLDIGNKHPWLVLSFDAFGQLGNGLSQDRFTCVCVSLPQVHCVCGGSCKEGDSRWFTLLQIALQNR